MARCSLLYKTGCVQAVVVNNEGSVLLRPALIQIELLPLYITPVLRRVQVRGARSALRASWNGDAEGDLQPHRHVPVGAQLRTVQKYSVQYQNRAGFGVLFGHLDRLFCLNVVNGDAVTARTAGAERVQWNPSTEARMTSRPDRSRTPASSSAKVVLPAPSTPSMATRVM